MELDWSDAAGASTWNKLFDRYYRRSEIYTMQWENVDLAKMVVAGSNFSGPIGLIPAFPRDFALRSEQRQSAGVGLWT
eukprot:1878851-Rhodomonas_salina.1